MLFVTNFNPYELLKNLIRLRKNIFIKIQVNYKMNVNNTTVKGTRNIEYDLELVL